jgi:hypothetical protein
MICNDPLVPASMNSPHFFATTSAAEYVTIRQWILDGALF